MSKKLGVRRNNFSAAIYAQYTSKCKRNECKEEDCKNTRANGSSRCSNHKI